MTGAPYHPPTNGTPEHLVQNFNQALRNSTQLPKKASLDFLRQCCQTPKESGFSPTKFLNGRQIWTKLDAILPSPAHIMQGTQARAISLNDDLRHPIHNLKQVILAMHCTLVPNQRFEMGSSRACQTNWQSYKPKAASGNIALTNFNHDILQLKMMTQARTTLLTLTISRILC